MPAPALTTPRPAPRRTAPSPHVGDSRKPARAGAARDSAPARARARGARKPARAGASAAPPPTKRPLRVVPRLDVWVVCPRCAGPAHVVSRGVFCTACTWNAEGGRSGHWCLCCWAWEGDRPSPVGPVDTRLDWRCPSCGRRETTRAPLTARSRPVRTCACGAEQRLVGRWSSARVADGVDALYGLPFYLSVPCAGRTLWVANREHAEYLLGYIGAVLRPPGPAGDRELGHFLPAWMVTRKHRDEVVRGLRRLLRRAETLPAG